MSLPETARSSRPSAASDEATDSSAAGQPGAADYPPVMSRHLLNLTTATRENALTDEEREAFLAEKRVGRLGTNRGDGWWHVTPIWYIWENGLFYLTLGNSRRHL